MCSIGEGVTTLRDHLWLSAEHRLLADSPACTQATLDLSGHSLVLPPDLTLNTPMPLVVVGAGTTLRIRNGTVYNADSLSACVSLAPSATLDLAEASVDLQPGPPEHMWDPLGDGGLHATGRAAGGGTAAQTTSVAKGAPARFQVRGCLCAQWMLHGACRPFCSSVRAACTVLCCTALCCTVLQHCTVLYCTLCYTVLCCSTVLYCTVLYCTVLYCTVLYCTVPVSYTHLTLPTTPYV